MTLSLNINEIIDDLKKYRELLIKAYQLDSIGQEEASQKILLELKPKIINVYFVIENLTKKTPE